MVTFLPRSRWCFAKIIIHIRYIVHITSDGSYRNRQKERNFNNQLQPFEGKRNRYTFTHLILSALLANNSINQFKGKGTHRCVAPVCWWILLINSIYITNSTIPANSYSAPRVQPLHCRRAAFVFCLFQMIGVIRSGILIVVVYTLSMMDMPVIR